MEALLLLVAALILGAGTVAWVFPEQAAAVAGFGALPALAILSLALAVILAAEWPLLRGLVAVLALTLLLGWNAESATSTSHLAGVCFGLLAMTLAGRVLRTSGQLRLAMLVFLAGGLAMMLLGLAGSSARSGPVATSLLPDSVPNVQLGLAGLGDGLVNPNALAAAVLLVGPLGWAVLIHGTGVRRDWLGLLPLSVLVVVTGGLVLVISDSLTAWAAIWLTVVAFLIRPGGARIARWTAGFVVASPLLLLWSAAIALGQDAFAGVAAEVWRSVHDRAYLMREGLELFKESPWLGIGLNEFRAVFRPNPSPAAHAHNMILQTALDIGVLGSIAYWSLLAFLIGRARSIATTASRLPRSVATGAALSLILVNLFGLTDAVPLGARIGLFQWLAGGLILAAGHARSEAA